MLGAEVSSTSFISFFNLFSPEKKCLVVGLLLCSDLHSTFPQGQKPASQDALRGEFQFHVSRQREKTTWWKSAFSSGYAVSLYCIGRFSVAIISTVERIAGWFRFCFT